MDFVFFNFFITVAVRASSEARAWTNPMRFLVVLRKTKTDDIRGQT